jgi:hypothetical protein
MSKPIEEAVPLVAALAGRLAGGAVASTAGEGLAGRLAAGLASKAAEHKVEQMMDHEKEEACDTCGCEENCEETGCDSCRQKVAQKKRDLEAIKNKYNIEMKERVEIVQFLKHLNEKNYALAHKYLKNIMEAKLSKRIAANKGVKVF